MGFRDGFGSGLGVGIGYKLAEYAMELGGILVLVVAVLLCGYCNSDRSSGSGTMHPTPNAPANSGRAIANTSNALANTANKANRAISTADSKSYVANAGTVTSSGVPARSANNTNSTTAGSAANRGIYAAANSTTWGNSAANAAGILQR